MENSYDITLTTVRAKRLASTRLKVKNNKKVFKSSIYFL